MGGCRQLDGKPLRLKGREASTRHPEFTWKRHLGEYRTGANPAFSGSTLLLALDAPQSIIRILLRARWPDRSRPHPIVLSAPSRLRNYIATKNRQDPRQPVVVTGRLRLNDRHR